MKNWIKTGLTRRVSVKREREEQTVEIPPDEKLLYAVYFSLGMVACLTVLEAVHLIVLGRWSSEIFTVIAGLIGNITGIFLTQKT